jgi:ferredoxin
MEPKLAELLQKLQNGDINRRDFIRTAGLLGFSIGAAEILAACSPNKSLKTPSGIQYQYEGYKTVPTSPHYFLTPESTSTPTSEAKVNMWYCSVCGEKFSSALAIQNHVLETHTWILPEVRQVDEPTYYQFLTDKVKQFDERNTIFSRIAWDEDYQQRVGKVMPFVTQTDPSFLEGNALVAGAIFVDQTAGSFHPYYPGYFGHIRDNGGLYSWDEEINPEKYPIGDPVEMSDRIKKVARFYGADLVGITKIDPRWVYENFFEPITGNAGPVGMKYKYAIVMGIEMTADMIDLSPGAEASAATAKAYSHMAEISSSLAKYIRMLGYPAVPSGNDSIQSIPLAIDAGLGELGRIGLMLSPEFGPRQRLCKVLTDLPLVPDKPIDFGIQKYCETCHSCAKACPAKAIRNEDRTTDQTSISNRPGILRWPVDVEKCYMFWQENGGIDCANCVAACPWAMQPRRKIF